MRMEGRPRATCETSAVNAGAAWCLWKCIGVYNTTVKQHVSGRSERKSKKGEGECYDK